MEKIAVLTTGGTIGSAITGAAKSVTGAQQRLRREIEALCRRRKLEIELVEVFNKNSEDAEPADWLRLIRAAREAIAKGIGRIVVTHGTDTLPYTATALALTLARASPARICLTGSYLSLDDPNSDVGLSLRAAFECVSAEALSPDVYVAFRASPANTRAVVIPALDLKPMDFDGEIFHGLYGRRVAEFGDNGLRVLARRHEEFRKSPVPRLPEAPLPDARAMDRASARVLLAMAYPGMRLGEAAEVMRSKDALVLSLYHSGTAPSEDQKGGLLQFLKSSRGKLPVFMAGFPVRYLTTPYASTLRLIEAGAGVYKDMQAFQIYTMLVLGLAQGLTARAVEDLLDPWRFKP